MRLTRWQPTSTARMSKRTGRYRLGDLVSERGDHLILLTAGPHKGDPENFRLLMRLLDKEKQGQFCFYQVKAEVLSAYITELQRRLGVGAIAVAPRMK